MFFSGETHTVKKNTDQGTERITQQSRTNFDTPV